MRAAAGVAVRRRPTFAVELLALGAWVALLTMLVGEALARSGSATPALWWCTAAMKSMAGFAPSAGAGAGAAGGVAGAVAAGLPMWALMAAAMMLPAALPAVRHVALSSLAWRRPRAIAEFLAVYLGIWIGYGAVVLAGLALLGRTNEQLAVLAALALALAWQLTSLKRRALSACHRGSPLPPRGWRASAGVARFALRNGGACLGSCWALMLVMAVASSERLPWMLALTAIVCAEKLANAPLRATRRTAAVLGFGALVVAVGVG